MTVSRSPQDWALLFEEQKPSDQTIKTYCQEKKYRGEHFLWTQKATTQ